MTAFWAIALNTMRMTTRRLAAVVTLVSILFGSLCIYSFVEGDNTLIGLLRVVTTWSFGFTSGLLMLLVLYFSSTVLDAEMVGKQIYLLDVKPVSRWKILMGKWLGVVIVMGGLLLVMGSLTYGALRWLAHRPPLPVTARAAEDAASTGEVGGDRDETASGELVRNELFVSRRSWKPRLTNIDRLLEDLSRDLKKRGLVDAETTETPTFRASLRALLERRVPPIASGRSRHFTFTGLPPPTTGSPDFHIRYKLYGRRGREPELQLRHRWELGHADAPEPFRQTSSSTAGRSEELRVPSAIIGPEGTLELSLTNLTGSPEDDPPTELIVPAADGIELLVPTGSFEMNLVRGLALVWIRLSMIAALGIAANTFLRGRVTAFFLLGVLLTGALNSFVQSLVVPEASGIEILRSLPPGGQAGDDPAGHDHLHPHDHHDRETDGPGSKLIDTWTKTVLPVLFGIFPDFADTDPVPDLLVGREIGWGRLAIQALYDIGLRAGLMWLVGLVCFYRKELGLPVIE